MRAVEQPARAAPLNVSVPLLVLFAQVPTPFVAPLIASVPVLIVSARAPIERMELPGRFVPARVVLVGF